MTTVNIEKIALEEQQELIAKGQPTIPIVSPCRLGDGILTPNEEAFKEWIEQFIQSEYSVLFFIPASGSGSRMFQFLFDFVHRPNEVNRGQVERFLNHIEDFAFLYSFPLNIQRQLKERTMELDEFVAYLLNDNGKGLAHLPKGLIPFHKNGPFILNPFQEHFLQGLQVTDDHCSFHFTIRPAFQDLIQATLTNLQGLTGKNSHITYSEQDASTDSYAFYEDGNPVINEDGNIVRRPAGHGTLVHNLNQLDAEILFLKNIDNVQHWDQYSDSISAQQLIGGLLISAKKEIDQTLKLNSKEALIQLNQEYQLFHQEDIVENWQNCMERLKLPLRVCGMVRNEGQPGGGPFWVKDKNGQLSKQIVEKTQIGLTGDQYKQMIQSTHFNPVLIACSGRLWNGEKVDFTQYTNPDHYFIVSKNHQGKDIQFIERPGLWNGSMYYWNSIFVEIPSTAFSPVKTVLDLLDTAHQPKNVY